MGKISVIVPVFRAEKYLGRCVDSILHQVYSDLELILVDDGSPDRCPKICDDYALRDKRVRVIHQKNAGVSEARNAGLDAATGEYITFVDSDDWIDPEMYQMMMEKASEYDCDLVMCDCVKEFPDHSEIYSHDIRSGYYDYAQLKKEYYPHLLMMENVEYPATISNWLCLFRQSQRQPIQQDGQIGTNHQIEEHNKLCLRYVKDIRYSEDLLFGAQVMYQARSFYYMKGEAYYHYDCTNILSATHNTPQNLWENHLRLYNAIRSFFGDAEDYDFSEQIDKVLLFLVYDAGSAYMGGSPGEKHENLVNLRKILNEPAVRQMFRRINIHSLPVSRGLKILTCAYKYQVGLGPLYDYFGRRR